MRVQLRHDASEHERFAPDAFASQVGKEVPVKVRDRKAATARVVNAEVIDDGRAVLLSYEVNDPDVLEFLRAGLMDSTGPGLSFQMHEVQEYRPDTAPPSPFVITVRYLDIAGERWIAPLGTPDPEPILEGQYDPRWVRAGDRRMTCRTDGTALVEPAELYQEADWVTRRWRT